jgi:hypothetical protein
MTSWTTLWRSKRVRSGSNSEVGVGYGHFRFAPNSRHWLARSRGQFCARGGHRQLFDHLVGTADQRQWHSYTEDLGGLKINNQLDSGRLLYR